MKFRLGLFERPFVDTSQPAPLLTAGHLQLARQLARESMVLLKSAPCREPSTGFTAGPDEDQKSGGDRSPGQRPPRSIGNLDS